MNPRSQIKTRLGFEPLEPRNLLSADPGWAIALGGPALEDDAEIRVGPDGQVYASGSFSGTVDFDPGPGLAQLTSQGSNDVFVAKYTQMGDLVWAKRVGGAGAEYSNSLEFDPAGDLVITGHFSSTTLAVGATTLVNQGHYDVFVAKFDAATGNAQWARGLGGAAQDTAYDLAVNAAGEVYVAGTFRLSADFDPGTAATVLTESASAGAGDAFVWKLDNAGGFVWARQFGNEFLDNGQSLALDGAGAVYAAGTFRGTVDYGQPGNPLPLTAPKIDSADLFVVKLDEATGDGIWARQATGPAHINAARLAADATGSIYFAGGFLQSVTFGSGTPTLISAGGTDAFLAKWDGDGMFQWAGALAGAGETLLQSLQVDAAGNPLMTFGFTGTVDFDPGASVANLTSTNSLDGAAVALNADGSFDWARQVSGPGNTYAQGLVADSEGNFYVSGSFQNSAALPTGHQLTASGNGTFLMKLAFGDPSTKFYVVDDGSANRTYEYAASGGSNGNSGLSSSNAAPRGAASTAAGNRVWVIDANRTVFVYDINGSLLGSWGAGTLASNATPEGIATNGTDVWIVDGKSDKVYKYTGAASRMSGSQTAASSFSLNSANADPKDIVTDGASLWVVNDSTADKVFKYSVAGSLLGSWTIGAANSKPTGITIDPANVSDIWIVDSGADRVYQYVGAASRTSGSQTAAASFALATGNGNPQGIADPPPAPGTTRRENRSASGKSMALVVAVSDSLAAGIESPVRLAKAAPAPTRASTLARQQAFESLAAEASYARPRRAPWYGIAAHGSNDSSLSAHIDDGDAAADLTFDLAREFDKLT